MLTQAEVHAARARAIAVFEAAGVALSKTEQETLEISDFGLGKLEQEGLEQVFYVNTDRYSAAEMVLFPRQTCPQHRHPPRDGGPGKEETFRCRSGFVYLYVEGDATAQPHCQAPQGSEAAYSVWHEIALGPGDQYTIAPDTWHWFQAGDEGAVISEFASPFADETDIFLDSRIARETVIGP